MKRVILTGATGFIGGWLLEELLVQGVQITALVCDDPNRIPNAVRSRIEIIPYDPENIFDAISLCGRDYDALYNLGWAGVAPEEKNDLTLHVNNIKCALDVVKFATEIECKRFIGIGTVAEYTRCDGLIAANQPPSPADVYGASKVAVHYMSEVLARQNSLNFNWVIVPSTFGERRNDANLITYTIKSLLKNHSPLYSSLEQMWDFLHVSDVAYALYLIGKKGCVGKTYGIGSGIFRPLKEYICEIRDQIDASLPLGIGKRQDNEKFVYSSCVDNSALVSDTGFAPRITFADGIERTIQYFREDEL